MPKPTPSRITVRLDPETAQAVIDAIVDCAMEGFPDVDLEQNCRETWGSRWRIRRRLAMSLADHLTMRLRAKAPR